MVRGEKTHTIRIEGVRHTYMQPAWWCSLDDPNDDECEFNHEDRAAFDAAKKETWQKARQAKAHATINANENADLKRVESYFFKKYMIAQRYTKSETRVVGQQTPDFRLLRDGALTAHCEVKSPQEDRWIEDELAEKVFDDADRGVQIAGGAKEDKIAARIARHIDAAVDQFDAVNADRALPNILVFVNHEPAATSGDLVEALTGYFFAEGGEKFAVNMRVAKGKIKDTKNRVDLYIWFDATDDDADEPQLLLFTNSNEEHLNTLCKWLGINKRQIRALA